MKTEIGRRGRPWLPFSVDEDVYGVIGRFMSTTVVGKLYGDACMPLICPTATRSLPRKRFWADECFLTRPSLLADRCRRGRPFLSYRTALWDI